MTEIKDIKVAVDAIVFGYQQNTLFVLLVKQKFGPFKGIWVLPGGFVLQQESLIEAVTRELQEEAGIKVNYLEQLYTFGDNINRDPRFRVISVAYFALVNPDNFALAQQNDTDAEEAQWFAISNIPQLGYDHNQIVKMAHQRLKSKLTYQPIGFDLLATEFPFSDLENLYSVILEQEIDRRNFRKKILSLGFVEETNAPSINNGSGRPARLFKFNKDKYYALLSNSFHFEIKFA
ncbi:NUDIX hydrolase [Emticicia sp. 17c]|uniref:NUDIX hydrolase n=1 Tax=Emticicia sp. 17c TaxID=3127704 RepID=UPI00301E34C4